VKEGEGSKGEGRGRVGGRKERGNEDWRKGKGVGVGTGPPIISVGTQSTLGGARHFCPKNMYEKLTKCPNFT